MSPFKFLRSCLSVFVYTSLATMILVVLPGIPPYIHFQSFKVTPSLALKGGLTPKFVLDKAELVVEGKFFGAESHAVDGETLYVGAEGGDILKIETGKKGVPVTKISGPSQPCQPGDTSCGRPFGVRLNSKGHLVVADAYKGIVEINVKTGVAKPYFSMDAPIEGAVPKFPDDLDVAKDGTVYWSDLASSFSPSEFSTRHIGDRSGRLIKYDPKTGNNTVLLSDLIMANGVQLSDKEDYVLVNEVTRSRTLRYYLKGPKAGTHDVFVDGLPGVCDNIRSNGKGGYFIAVVADRIPLVDALSALPQLRKLVFRVQWFVLAGVSIMEKTRIFNSEWISGWWAYLENFGPYGFSWISKTSIIEVDANGKILGWYRTSKEAPVVTQFTAGKKYGYFSSVADDKLWRIKLSDLRK